MGYPESLKELEQWRDDLRGSLSGDELIKAIEERIAQESERFKVLDQFLAQEHTALGNHAAAEAIRARDRVVEIYRWHDQWRDQNREADIVPVLEERIRREIDSARLQTLRWLLADEHLVRGNYLAAEAIHLADADDRPNSPRPLISLAMQKLLHEDRPEDAMPYADRAVTVAMQAGVFRREALGVKARAAVALSDYFAVEGALREIMQLLFMRGNFDISVERDFFDALPPGSIDPGVATAYHEYCSAKGLKRTASSEQIRQSVLAAVRPKWLKVARIITEVLNECERAELASSGDAIAAQIGILVAAGSLEAHGDLAKWRYSEVRLSDKVADARSEEASPTGADDDVMAGRSIAGRILTMKVGRREVRVPITIYAPVDKGDHWRCTFEIGWPGRPKVGTGNGADAVQALLIALKFVGTELYASKAHADGKLKSEGLRVGYGFPLPWSNREEAVGEDKYL